MITSLEIVLILGESIVRWTIWIVKIVILKIANEPKM
jgi:hypothetical protein